MGYRGVKPESTHPLKGLGSICHAWMTAAAQLIPFAVVTGVAIETILFDRLGEFNIVLNRFAPRFTGYYRVTAQLYWGTEVANWRHFCYVYDQFGARRLVADEISLAGSFPTQKVDGILYIEVGQWIEVAAQTLIAGGTNVNGGAVDATYISVNRVG